MTAARTHTINVPSWVIDFILLRPLLRRVVRRLRKRLAKSRRWM